MDVTYSLVFMDIKKLILTHLPDSTLKAFDMLADQNWLKDEGWYLAGGTALSLQCGNRVSVDLDFFTPNTDFEIENIISALTSLGWITSFREAGTLYGELAGAKISFISYPYFTPKQPFIEHKSINILDMQDIAVMKVIAISQRGKKRDFFDLYWYAIHNEPLSNVLQRIKSQYPNSKHNYHHIIKSLTYFNEAEEDPEPTIFFDATWDRVKQYFTSSISGIAEKIFD